MIKKVSIEITDKGWSVTVQKGEKTFIERHVVTPIGSKCIEGDFENESGISEDLYYALSSFSNFDIMNALIKEK